MVELLASTTSDRAWLPTGAPVEIYISSVFRSNSRCLGESSTFIITCVILTWARRVPRVGLRRSDTQRRQKSLLWYLYATYLFHAAFAFFLLFEEFSFAGYVAAVAFGRYVFAVGAYGFAGYDAFTHGGLHGDLELLAGMSSLSFSTRARPR